MPEHIFNKKDPLIFGATVIEGTLRLNTPLCAIKDTEVGDVTLLVDVMVGLTCGMNVELVSWSCDEY